jgi:D-alanine-D-alanine ligase
VSIIRIGLTYELKRALAGREVQEDDLLEAEEDYTIAELAEAIEANGHEVVRIGTAHDLLRDLRSARGLQVDAVFNYAVGMRSRARETWVPAILDVAGIPCVGSDALTLAVASDKYATTAIARGVGVPAPRTVLVNDLDELREARTPPLPVIVKPRYEGSSIGIWEDSLIRKEEDLETRVQRVLQDYGQSAIVQEFIPGREIAVPLLGSPLQAYGVVGMSIDGDMDLGDRFLWNFLKADYRRAVARWPAGLDPSVESQAMRFAETICKALEVRDFARCDFRVSADGVPYLLEVNPIAHLQRINGEFVVAGSPKGHSFHAIVGMILQSAIGRILAERTDQREEAPV